MHFATGFDASLASSPWAFERISVSIEPCSPIRALHDASIIERFAAIANSDALHCGGGF